MASSEHLKALIKSHLEDDDEPFHVLTLQVAAHGRRVVAHGHWQKELRDIVERAKKRSYQTLSIYCEGNFL